MNPMLVTWEAILTDGEVQRERDGVLYKDINRDRLKAFNLVGAGELLLHFPIPPDRSGNQFVYRRRTAMGYGPGGSNKVTVFLLGILPTGPVILFNPETMEVAHKETFVDNDALWSAPTPHPEDGENFTFTMRGHKADAQVKPTRITLPSGMKMDVK